MRICVVIPSYNEAREIARLVSGVRKQGLDVLVVDDGSTDETVKLAEGAGAKVLSNVTNHGKGTSLIRGFNHALQNGFDAVIAMDGDGQHLPEDIPNFLVKAEHSDSGIFIGNRMDKPKNMPWYRLVTNRAMSSFISAVTGQHIPDTQCGFRLLKKEVLERMDLKTSNYEIESEMLIKAARAGFRIESVPISTVYSGEKSKINPFVDTLRFIKYVIKELITRRS
jgi:glycosyltransferase involved in cell wall biosynthesis